MKTIEVSDETYEMLKNAAEKNRVTIEVEIEKKFKKNGKTFFELAKETHWQSDVTDGSIHHDKYVYAPHEL